MNVRRSLFGSLPDERQYPYPVLASTARTAHATLWRRYNASVVCGSACLNGFSARVAGMHVSTRLSCRAFDPESSHRHDRESQAKDGSSVDQHTGTTAQKTKLVFHLATVILTFLLALNKTQTKLIRYYIANSCLVPRLRTGQRHRGKQRGQHRRGHQRHQRRQSGMQRPRKRRRRLSQWQRRQKMWEQRWWQSWQLRRPRQERQKPQRGDCGAC